ncbi:GntR family transcriptional regulator [Paraburkholderia sediminicola]|uniref:GntR family transcriptional regulator n=1 Tax=Paraburkholderia sediminicola TaxID=458836 RepID=UPI0038BD2014
MTERTERTADAPVTVGDQLLNRMAQDIFSGVLPPGTKIVEVDLAARYEVSRATLRETIARLEERRLVLRTPHAGVRVAQLSRKEVLEMFVVREALEGMACRLAALNATEAQIEALRQHAEFEEAGMRAYSELDDKTHSVELANEVNPAYGQKDFHVMIANFSGIALLETLIQSDINRLTRLYRFKDLEGRGRRALIEHNRIVEAIAERDADMAELAGRRHIAGLRKEFERLTETNSDWLKLCA